MTQVEMCFRFTFWDFDWTVMGPITFFAASSFLLADYAYFLVTSSDLSYRGFMERLVLARRAKLYAKHGFDMDKYLEMERQLRCPLGGDHSRAATKAIFEEIERQLRDGQDDQVVGYDDKLLGALLESGLVRTEAEALIRGMEENRLALLVRGKAYLNHKKVVGLIRRAVPFALAPENDARKEEFKQLQEKMQEIDGLAQKHAKRVLCFSLAYFIFQFVIFFRLTFWEFDWSVMEPIAFFAAGIQLILCYGYFLITSSNPTLKDLMQRLVLTRRRKLCAKRSFDMDRYLELQKHSR
ncbi:hypothetical protein BRADI_1g50881v3 [Brachypodium distachyon]|nr:hypothetical protein BRADI_1g50881v3 [Brachypodium distachyon]